MVQSVQNKNVKPTLSTQKSNSVNIQTKSVKQKNNLNVKNTGLQKDAFIQEGSIENLKKEFEELQKKQGFIGKTWNKFKNATGLGLSSKDVEQRIQQYQDGQISYDEALKAVQSFGSKQKGLVDIVANVVSGFVVVGSTVLTGGLSLLGGAVIGGGFKAAIKTLERSTNEVKGDAIDAKEIAKDVVTGAVDGAVTVATAGMVKGPVVGQSVKAAVKTGVIQGAKAGAISGAATSATNYTVEAIAEDDVKFNVGEFAKTTAQGAAIGGTFGGVTGGVSGGIAQAKFNAPEIVQLADNLKIKAGDVEGSEQLSKYLAKNSKVNVKELNEYIKNIDTDELYRVAPQIQDYSPEQLMKFYDYHFKAGTTSFNAETLSMDSGLTQFLRENYTTVDELDDLLDVLPSTSRNVGDMPDGWLTNIPVDKRGQASEEIFEAITHFQQNRDIIALEKELTAVMGKDVKIKHLGSGSYGTGYKVTVDGADDTVLKIFHKSCVGDELAELGKDLPTMIRKPLKANIEKSYQVHGQHIETQTGLFVNEHSDDFVKMYFGRVAGKNNQDGFLVTQFLDDGVTPVPKTTVKPGYNIKSNDAFTLDSFKGKLFGPLMGGKDHNIINGKIIDYGAVKVKPTGIKGFLSGLKSLFTAA